MYIILSCGVVTAYVMFVYNGDIKRIVRDFLALILTYVYTANSTVEDLINSKKNKVETVALPGVVAVITGGERGIGFELIKKLLMSDASVIIGCPSDDAGERGIANIRKAGVTAGEVKCYHLDLTSMSSVKSFAETVLKHHPEIHLLINNAGLTLESRRLTEDGVETTFSVNYLGHCYLSHLLLPRLAESARTRGRNARIVNVSSCFHAYPMIGDIHFKDLTLRDNYQEYVAYGQSKLAVLMFTKTLDAKLKAAGVPVQVHAVHPGLVFSHITMQNIFTRMLPWLYALLFRNTEEGSRSMYYACASREIEEEGGTYITSCTVSPSSDLSNNETAQNKLWTMMMSLLNLKTFGRIEKP